jgi:hypothetical protein
MPERRLTYVLRPYAFGPEFEIGAEIGDTEFWVRDKHHWSVNSDKRGDVPALSCGGVVGEMDPTAEVMIG